MIIAIIVGIIAILGFALWMALLNQEERWEQDNRQRRTEEHLALLYDYLKLRVKFVPAHKVVEKIESAKKSN